MRFIKLSSEFVTTTDFFIQEGADLEERAPLTHGHQHRRCIRAIQDLVMVDPPLVVQKFQKRLKCRMRAQRLQFLAGTDLRLDGRGDRGNLSPLTHRLPPEVMGSMRCAGGDA